MGDPQLADDTLQDLYLLAVKKCDEIADADHLAAWLRKAARLKALDTLRARQRLPINLTSEVLEQFETFWAERDAVSDSRVMAALRQCIARLNDANQALLKLRYVEGKKPSDIAHLQNRRVEAVYKAIVRLHRQLRDCVERRLPETALHE